MDYVKSGFAAVAFFLAEHEGYPADDILHRLWVEFALEDSHVFDRLVPSYVCTRIRVEDLVVVYRTHRPEIALRQGAEALLRGLDDCMYTAVLTDGPTGVQQRKVEVLGLGELVSKIVYTDRLGPERRAWKPSPIGFQHLLGHFGVGARDALYVGDNPAKDFVAPRALGMHTVRLRTEDQLHFAIEPEGGCEPEYEIASLLQLEKTYKHLGWK